MKQKSPQELKAEIKTALRARLERRRKKESLPNAIIDPSDGFGEVFDRFSGVPVDVFMEAFNEHLTELQKTKR